MSTSGAWSERILRVTDYIQANLERELSPTELAQVAGFSAHHFHRVFRGMVGESVMGFIRRLRLERGAQRLKFGGSPVTDVALASGYGSHEAFTRAFRSRFGTSPSMFREQHRVSVAELEVQIVERAPSTCLTRRFVGDYGECARAWAELESIVAGHPELPPSGRSLGMAYDDPEVTAADQLRYDACLEFAPAPRRDAAPAGTTVRTIPGGRYAVATHRGPHETLTETYVALLGRWLPVDFKKVAA